MLPAMERLTASSARLTGEVDSIATFIQGLAAQIRDNAGDPTALQKIADDIDGNSARLIAARVLENTPAAPAPGAGGQP
jgi:hypothetical protein